MAETLNNRNTDGTIETTETPLPQTLTIEGDKREADKNIANNPTLPTKPKLAMSSLVKTFLEANHNKLSANTRRSYGYDLELFALSLPPELEANDIETAHLRAFLAATSEELAPTTLARRQAALRSCFTWCYRNNLLSNNPTDRLEPIKIPERDPRPLSEAQAEALLEAIPNSDERNRLLFNLLYETGMRVGEAISIQFQNIQQNTTDGGYIRIIGKGNKERIIPLIDAPRSTRLLRKVIKEWSSKATSPASKVVGPLFKGNLNKGGSTSQAMDYTTVWYHFEKYVKAAKEKRPDLFATETEPITIHRLRHTYATIKLRDGVSLPTIRKLMGHKNLQTTLRYADTDMETIKRELVEARQRHKH
jgi:site-specific recombinase XerD